MFERGKKIIIVSLLLIFWPIFVSAKTFEKNLYFGMTHNSQVFKLQQFLKEQGFYTGPLSGSFYALTKTAVKKFQKAHSITPALGYFGPLTRAKVNKILSSKLSSITSPKLNVAPEQDAAFFEEAYQTYNLNALGKVSDEKAIVKLRRVITEFPQSSSAASSQFLIAKVADRFLNGIRPDGAKVRAEYELLKTQWPNTYPNSRIQKEILWEVTLRCDKKSDEEITLKTPWGALAQYHIARSYLYPYEIDYTKAQAAFQKLIEEYPDIDIAASAHFKLTVIFDILKDYTSEITMLEKIITQYPYQDALHVLTYQKLGDLLLFTGNAEKLDALAEKLAVRASATDFVYESSVPVFGCKPQRWQKQKLNVTIATGFTFEQNELIKKALALWPDATGGKISFDVSQRLPKYSEIYNDAHSADIYIVTRESPEGIILVPILGDHPAAGVTYISSRGDNVILKTDIALTSTDTPSQIFFGTALHEIGHALGLGHSFNRNDIMALSGLNFENLSSRDKNTARLMYE